MAQSPPLTLALLRGPSPGALAMPEHPPLGLNAFCEKVLAEELDQGDALVPSSCIARLDRLRAGASNEPQRTIDARMTKPLTRAVGGTDGDRSKGDWLTSLWLPMGSRVR